MNEFFRALRKERGITATFVSNKIGISKQRMWKIEHGRSQITGRELALLCKFYDVDCRTLV